MKMNVKNVSMSQQQVQDKFCTPIIMYEEAGNLIQNTTFPLCTTSYNIQF